MSRAVVTLLRVQMRSLRNGLSADARVRIEGLLNAGNGAVFALVATFWFARRLAVWQAEGPQAVDAGMETALWITWFSIGGLSLMGAIRQAFGSDEARLLLTLPLSPGARFRSLYTLILLDQGVVWLLAVTVTYAVALVQVLGSSGLVWLLPLLLGVAVAVWLGAIGTILAVRYLLPHLRIVALALGGVALLEGAVFLWVGESAPALSWPLPAPLPLSAGLLFLIFVGLGPLAPGSGRQYIAAYQLLESRSRRGAIWRFPFLGLLASVVERRRTLTGALLARALREQSRHPLALPRLLVLPLYVVIYPWLHARLALLGFTPPMDAAVFAATVGVLGLIEYGVAFPLAGEGARLSLYLAAPLRLGTILRAKLVVALLPLLALSAGFAVAAGLWSGLSAQDAGIAALVAMALVGGIGGLVIPASAWDVDLRAVPSGDAELLLQEDLPITPRRLQLLGVAGFLLSVGVVLVRLLPRGMLIPVLLLLDGVLLALGWQIGLAGMDRLRRGEGVIG